MRYIVENYVSRQWTQQDVDQAALFFKCATQHPESYLADSKPKVDIHIHAGGNWCQRRTGPYKGGRLDMQSLSLMSTGSARISQMIIVRMLQPALRSMDAGTNCFI